MHLYADWTPLLLAILLKNVNKTMIWINRYDIPQKMHDRYMLIDLE